MFEDARDDVIEKLCNTVDEIGSRNLTRTGRVLEGKAYMKKDERHGMGHMVFIKAEKNVH